MDPIWDKGIITLEYPRNAAKTTNYVTGYITKSTFQRRDHYNINTGLITADDRQAEFSLMSKNMGLSYLTPEIKKFYRDTKTFVYQKKTENSYQCHATIKIKYSHQKN